VLFTFPSRYLFAIGLPSVFSLRWDLPPALGCIPKQPDSANALRGAAQQRPTGFSPFRTPLSRELGPRAPQETHLETTIRQPRAGDFQGGRFPVRSPLLGESWLVSFPPLIDMLKFSGWSCLSSGRRGGDERPLLQAPHGATAVDKAAAGSQPSLSTPTQRAAGNQHFSRPGATRDGQLRAPWRQSTKGRGNSRR
jgi:hypothetical protein